MRIRDLVVLSIVASILAACSGDTEPPPASAETATPSPTLSPTDDPFAGCPNGPSLAGDATRLDPPLSGDVDGDEVEEDVFLHFDARGELGCQAFIVAETAAGTVAGPIWPTGPEAGLAQPRLLGLAAIDPEPGAEVLVAEAGGASTQFVAAYSLAGGRVRRIEAEYGDNSIWPDLDGLFPYGGSVGHIEGVDCTEDGGVVMSLATPGETRKELREGLYDLRRGIFRFEGDRLVLDSVERVEVSAQEINTYPEYQSSPFGSCPVP